MKTFFYCVSARNDFKVINRTTLLTDGSSAMTDTGFSKAEKALIAELWVPANRAMIALFKKQNTISDSLALFGNFASVCDLLSKCINGLPYLRTSLDFFTFNSIIKRNTAIITPVWSR